MPNKLSRLMSPVTQARRRLDGIDKLPTPDGVDERVSAVSAAMGDLAVTASKEQRLPAEQLVSNGSAQNAGRLELKLSQEQA